VQSRPGSGSTFTIFLPATQEAARPKAERPRPARAPRGTETVLVVEDEAAVRELVTTALRGAGYRVLAAADGQDALALLTRGAADVDLVLTDVVLPGMDGRDLERRIRLEWPRLPVAFMSGYVQVEAEAGGLPGPFIAKPMSPSAIANLVRRLLDARAAADACVRGT
jgi:CheY-like chemotaxis protein